MRPPKISELIHLFALLHAAAALACYWTIDDELILTLLTITMVVLICLKRGMTVEFTAACVIVVNVVGYLLGTGGATLIRHLLHVEPAVHAVSTLLTTELLGWGVAGYIRLFRQGAPAQRRPSGWTPRIGLLLLAVGLIFVLRWAYVTFFTRSALPAMRFYHIVNLLFSNSIVLIILLGANVIYIRHSRRRAGRGIAWELGMLLLFVVLTSLIATLVIILGLPFAFEPDFTRTEFMQMWVIALLIEVILYAVIFMIDSAFVARAGLRVERGKTHRAQFRYMKLKQQVNPHFLFNSLNILDCLVCEERTEQARAYIHKLAGIYRYMLQNEEQTLVPLHEEMDFAEMYIDLMQVRFNDGFRVEIEIPQEAMQGMVVPGAVQLLLENAIKHNAVGEPTPLVIRIVATRNTVSVANNLLPKVSAAVSTRVGLNYIRQQYLDLSDTPIEIRRTEREYCVTLPLL